MLPENYPRTTFSNTWRISLGLHQRKYMKETWSSVVVRSKLIRQLQLHSSEKMLRIPCKAVCLELWEKMMLQNKCLIVWLHNAATRTLIVKSSKTGECKTHAILYVYLTSPFPNLSELEIMADDSSVCSSNKLCNIATS